MVLINTTNQKSMCNFSYLTDSWIEIMLITVKLKFVSSQFSKIQSWLASQGYLVRLILIFIIAYIHAITDLHAVDVAKFIVELWANVVHPKLIFIPLTWLYCYSVNVTVRLPTKYQLAVDNSQWNYALMCAHFSCRH
jgi:hypothetical protein